MKILVLTRSIPLHHIGGMEMLVWDFARALRRQGVDVCVLTSTVPGYAREFDVDDVNVKVVTGSTPGGYSPVFWKELPGLVIREVSRGRVDAIIGVSAAARGLVNFGADNGVPVILQAHGSSLGEILTKWRRPSIRSIGSSLRNILWLFKDRAVISKYAAVVCVSERVKKELESPLSRMRLAAPAIMVIKNGIDISAFSLDEQTRLKRRNALQWAGKSVIAVSCRLHAEKGVKELIEAFAEVTRRSADTRLLIVGDGPELEHLKSLASALNLGDKVHFTGAVKRSEMAGWLSTGDIFAFLSLRLEGAPLNILEALAVGLPMVVSEDLVDRVPSDSYVWGVSPRNANEAADAMIEALDKASKGARTNLPPEYHIDQCAIKYIQLIDNLKN